MRKGGLGTDHKYCEHLPETLDVQFVSQKILKCFLGRPVLQDALPKEKAKRTGG